MTDPKTLREAAERALEWMDGCGLDAEDSALRDALRSALARDEEERAEIVAVLSACEWVGDSPRASWDRCGICHQQRVEGHTPDCRLASLLRRLGSK